MILLWLVSMILIYLEFVMCRCLLFPQPISEMGKESFHILKAELEGKVKGGKVKKVLETKLILRKSSRK